MDRDNLICLDTFPAPKFNKILG